MQLAGVSGGGGNIFRDQDNNKNLPALSLAIGGQDRVDGSGRHWMTHSNYRSCGCWRSSPIDVNFVLVGSLWGVLKKLMVGQLLHGAKDDGGGG